MSKSERVKLIIELLDKQDRTYEVLSYSGKTPNHVRVNNFGDIWPSTGSFRIGSKTTKRNFDRLIKALGGDITIPKKLTNADLEVLVTRLMEQVSILTDRVELQEDELCSLKSKLNID